MRNLKSHKAGFKEIQKLIAASRLPEAIELIHKTLKGVFKWVERASHHLVSLVIAAWVVILLWHLKQNFYKITPPPILQATQSLLFSSRRRLCPRLH